MFLKKQIVVNIKSLKIRIDDGKYLSFKCRLNSKSLDRHVEVTIVPEIRETNLHWQNKTPSIQDILIPTVTIGPEFRCSKYYSLNQYINEN